MDPESDHRADADPTVAAPRSVATPTTQPAMPERAKPKRRRRSRILLAAAVAAVVVTAVGVVAYMRQPTRNAASTPAASAPADQHRAPRPAVVLDGTYRFDYDYEKQTINGAPYAIHTTDNTAWWAFRTSCGPLDASPPGPSWTRKNPQVARTPAQPAEYRFVDGHWQSVPVQRQLAQPRCLGANGNVVAGANTVLLRWSLEPQPDGTLRGTKTGTALTNECGLQGQVALAPVVATRVGDVPTGVAVADPATVTAPVDHAPQPHTSRGPSSTAPTAWTSICRIRRSTAR